MSVYGPCLRQLRAYLQHSKSYETLRRSARHALLVSSVLCAATVAFIAASADAQQTVEVGNWAFDEGSGTTAVDASGFGNDGSIVGGATWIAGISGSALRFGGNGDRVQGLLRPNSMGDRRDPRITVGVGYWTWNGGRSSQFCRGL